MQGMQGGGGIESARSWWLAALALVIASLSFGAVTAVPILLKPLAREWDTGAASIAWVHTSTLVGAGLGSLLLARLTDRHGFFPVAVAAALTTAAGLFLASRADGVTTLHLVCGLILGGIGQGAFFSPLAVALSRWFDRHRALALAIASCGQSVGGFVVPPLLRLGAERLGWRSTLEIYAGIALLVLLPAAWAFRRRPPAPREDAVQPAAAAGTGPRERKRRFATLAAGLALASLATFAVVGHLIAHGEERGFEPMAAAALVSTLLGATLVFRLLAGLALQRCGTYRLLVLATALHLAGIAGVAASEGYAALAASAALVGLGFGGYIPAYAVLVRDMFPAQESARRVAEIWFFAFAAAGLGSGAGGWLRDASGSYALPFQAAVTVAAASLLLLCARRRLLAPEDRACGPSQRSAA